MGLYGNAYNLCTTASKPIYSIILRVTFPALSKIQDDPAAITFALASRAIGLGLGQGVAPILRAGTAVLLMGAAVYATRSSMSDLPGWTRLAAAVTVASYLLATLAVNRSAFDASVTGLRSVVMSKGRLA